MIQSVIGIMARNKDLPEAQEAADAMGGEIQAIVKFSSPFFSAQKQESAGRVMAFLERRISLFQATQDPAYMEDIDPDRLRIFDSQMSDVPTSIFRTQEEIDQIRQARAQKESQQRALDEQQQAQQIEQGAAPQARRPEFVE